MIKEIIKTGAFGTNTKQPINNNFNYLFNNPASKLQRFISKVRSYSIYKSDTIRVSVWADSIWGTYLTEFESLIEGIFPDKTFEYCHAQLGGSGANYQSAMVWEVINFNPDLIIIEEYEDFENQEIAEYLIKTIKQKTSADIIMFPFPIRGTDLSYLSAQNITAYKESLSYQTRQWFYSIASKYDCAIVDADQDVIYDLLNGTVTTAQLTSDGIHRLDYWYTQYVTPLFNLFFKQLYDNIYLNNEKSDLFKTIALWADLTLPDISEGTYSGTWVVNSVKSSVYIPTSFTFNCVQTSDVGAYYECVIEGIGFELAYFGDAVGQFKIEIGLNGGALANPSTLLKDYATSAHNVLVGVYKIIVDSNILSNGEIEREFEIEMLSATTYKVTDTTNATVVLALGTVTNNESFAVTGGQLTIPANYAGENNWRGTLATGQTYTFSVKKNWYDTIDISADNLTRVVRIFGFERGKHTLRITRNSGTVNLDSILELK